MRGFGIIKKCLLMLIISLGLFWFLLSSSAGLSLSCWILAASLPGKLQIDQLSGRLLDKVRARGIHYTHDGLKIDIDDLAINYKLHFPGLQQTGEPLIKGDIMTGKITVNDLLLQDFRGSFFGNSLKTIQAEGQFKGQYEKLPFTGLMHLQQQLQVRLFSGKNQLKITGRFPWPWKADAVIEEPALVHPDLAGLNSIIKADANLQGEHAGKLRIHFAKGYLDTKAIQGLHFLSADFEADLKPQGMSSKGLIHIDKEKKFTFHLNFPRYKSWQGDGNLYNGDKKLSLKGSGKIRPQPEGKIDLQGHDFPLMESAEYKIWVSPALQANFNADALTLGGNIVIPEAQIAPVTFEDSLVLSDDVSFAEPGDQPLPFNISGEVNVNMGEKVFLDIKGLKTRLAGSINLNKTGPGPVTAAGQLQVKEGKYKAYGQDLDIQQGQLLFTGGLVTNPGIQLKAAKTLTNFDDLSANNPFGNKITVGVEVSGWLNAPKIELFANPSTLSQADILSLLLLGHRASEAGKSGGQLLMAAISSMNLGSGSKGAQLLEQVKNSLGIDVNVKSTRSYNQKTNSVKDSTGVEIGKSISRRLYVSYNRGLTTQADANVLTLKYLLSKFFSLQVTASDAGNGIDLLYSSQKDEKNAK